MNGLSRFLRWLAPAAFVGLLALAVGCTAPQAGGADGDSASGVRDMISVSGFGETTGAPDIATVQLAVEIEADTIAEALELSNQTVESVRDALLAMGIAETDMQSMNFNVWGEDVFDREFGRETGERIYHVDSTLSVKVRDIGRVSEVIQTGLDAGVTNIWGLSFGIDERAALEAEARSLALEDAADRAQQLADSLGLTLGEPLAVSELAGGAFLPFGLQGAFGAEMGGGAGIPISPGELTVTIQVDVMYAVTR